jgi:cytochrome c553
MRIELVSTGVAALLMLSACSLVSRAPSEMAARVTPAELEFCSQCHYQEGTSVGSEVPKIAGQYPAYLRQQVEAFKEGKRDSVTMQDIASLHTEKEMEKLARFFSSLRPNNAPSINPATVPRGVRSRGQYLFEEERVYGISCADCHGDDAMGYAHHAYQRPATSNLRAIPRLAGQKPVYLASRLQSYEKGEVKVGMCTMRKAGETLSKDDIEALVDYLSSLTPSSQ